MIGRKARRPAALGALLGGAAVALPIALLWGYSVDDAFITARVAAHVARGLGHRFNTGGPTVDAVTPLGFEYLLALASGGSLLRAHSFAKCLGAVAGLAAMAWLGREMAASGKRGLLVLLPMTLSAPLAAWCASGMETGLVVLLATLALGPVPLSIVGAGLAAGLRPELVPWALALSFGRAVAAGVPARDVSVRVVGTILPAAIVAGVRTVAFGSPVPLAFHAKPSDAAHGLFYVAGALLWTGAPALVVAPRLIRRLGGADRAVLSAAVVHCLALVVAGGDWMALFRLFVPILPGLYLVGARLLTLGGGAPSAVRLAIATIVSAVLVFDKGAAIRGVESSRLALIDGARPALAGARVVAALDVGWVSFSTEADVADLAGVTDPSVAHLPGGHTSKRIPEHWLEHHAVDRLVLLSDGPPGGAPVGASGDELRSIRWARAVEARVAREAEDLGFVVRAVLPLSGTAQMYLVLGPRNES